MFPPGNSNAGMLVAILPYIEQRPLYDRWDFNDVSNNPSMDGSNQEIMKVKVPLYPAQATRASSVWPLGDRETLPPATPETRSVALKYGYNGMFRDLNYPPGLSGPIRAIDVSKGLSNTAAVSEILHGDGTAARLRVNWHTPKTFLDRSQYDEFATMRLRVLSADRLWLPVVARRGGLPWTNGNMGYTMYNHILGPNEPSCSNGGDVQNGIYSAASAHDGGVNLIYGDGHTKFINNSIDINVWRSLGARVELPVTF